MRTSPQVVRSRRVERWVSVSFSVGLFLPACQLVFGDYTQADEDPVSTGGAASTETGGSPSTGGRPSTVTTSACPSDAGFFCKDGVLFDCKSGATTDCGSDSLCRADLKKCLACTSGSYSCEGTVLIQCNAAQTGWNTLSDCAENADKPYCETGVSECVTCVRGNQICEGSLLRTCSNTRTWTNTECAQQDKPFTCVTDSDVKAHCERCHTATFVSACSGNILMTCVVDQIVSQSCPTTCLPASGDTPARCE